MSDWASKLGPLEGLYRDATGPCGRTSPGATLAGVMIPVTHTGPGTMEVSAMDKTPQRRSTDTEASPERLKLVEVQERLCNLERLRERMQMDVDAMGESLALIREAVGDE